MKNGNKKILFKESYYYPEDCVEIEGPIFDGKYFVSEVHRDEKTIKAEAETAEEAGFFAAILYKNPYDGVIDRKEVRELDAYLNLGESQYVLDYIIRKFDDSIYSIDCVEYPKISIIRSDDKVDVMFAGEYIVKDEEIRIGYGVFFNYCTLLNYIKSLCDEIEQEYDFKICRERVYRLYILGK